MRANLATPLFLAVALILSAKAPPDPEEVLAKARDSILDRTERLPNYICVQTVDRQYLKPTKAAFPLLSCDDLSARKTRKKNDLRLEATDRRAWTSRFPGARRSAPGRAPASSATATS